jgi:DNA-binding NarL/FixJ family response regulator
MIRLFHCDDSDAMRLLIREQFGPTGRVEVVGGAADPVTAVSGAKELQPDVVLLDLLDPENAERLVSEIRSAAPASWSTAAIRPTPREPPTAARTPTSRSRRRSACWSRPSSDSRTGPV